METHKTSRENQHYFLDCGGKCFLCLKILNEAEGNVKENDSKSANNKFSLLKMSRFLQIDICRLHPDLFSTLNINGRNNELQVSLCDQCENVYNLFTELYTILEETKLLMNSCINKIHQVIQDAQNDNHTKHAGIKRKLHESAIGKDDKVVESLRKTIMFKCERKLTSSAPRVILSNLSDNEIKRWKPQPSINLNQGPISIPVVTKYEPVSLDSNDIVKLEELSSYMDWNEDTSYSPSDPGSDDLSPSDTEINQNEPSTIQTPNFATCSYCSFKVIYKRRERLHHHLGIQHPEHYLPELFQQLEIPKEEFKKVVHFHLKCFIKEGNCAICSKKYYMNCKSVRLTYVKTHLFKKHAQKLEKRILTMANLGKLLPTSANEEDMIMSGVDLSEDESESGSSPTSVTTDPNRTRQKVRKVECAYCNKIFFAHRPAKLNLHYAHFHPEHFFPTFIQRLNVSSEQFKKSLESIYKKFMKNENCALCRVKYNSKTISEKIRYVKLHLLQEHNKELEEELMELIGRFEMADPLEDPDFGPMPVLVPQVDEKPKEGKQRESSNQEESSSPIADWNEDTFHSYSDVIERPPTDIEINLNEYIPPKLKYPLSLKKSSNFASCPYCDFKVFNKRGEKLKKHLSSNHPEHYFPASFQQLGIPREEFKKVVNYQLKHFIKEENCAVCSKKYSINCKYMRFIFVKTHLFEKHAQKLEKRILLMAKLGKLLPTSNEESMVIRGDGLVEEETESEGPSTSYTNSTRPKLSPKVKCSYCNNIISAYRRIKLNLHFGHFHPEHFFPDLFQQLNVSREKFRRTLETIYKSLIVNDNCSLCCIKYNSKTKSERIRSVKLHLLQQHNKELEEKLLEPRRFEMEDPLAVSKPVFFRKRVLVRKVSEKSNALKKTPYVCTHCRKGFRRNFGLQIHVLSKHKDILFPSMKKDDVTDAQFRIIVDHLIFKDFIKDLHCALCDKGNIRTFIQGKLVETKDHLLQDHRKKLIEKLMEIQNDPVIMNQITESNHVCQCGLLFRRRPEFMEHANKCEVHEAIMGKKVACDDCGNKVTRTRLSRHKKVNCRVSKMSEVTKKANSNKLDFPREGRREKAKCLKCGELLDLQLLPEHRDNCPGMKQIETMQMTMELDRQTFVVDRIF